MGLQGLMLLRTAHIVPDIEDLEGVQLWGVGQRKNALGAELIAPHVQSF